jgi:hypothetical protein
MKVGLRCCGIDIFSLPMGTGIVKAVPAAGSAEIIGNQSARYQMFYSEISQWSLSSAFHYIIIFFYIAVLK